MPSFGDPPVKVSRSEEGALTVQETLLWRILQELEVANYGAVKTQVLTDLTSIPAV